jgi:chromosome segregation protein
MYLKSIVVKGFKSFPDRTKLDFGPGTSVIVGPNGSGKSNVTDAVLWALGEQSPVAVRGQSMQDVIFGGAPGRKAAPAAEVELVLDDSEGTLGLGAPEISIYRRLDRGGEGEYRLAGAKCRLVDVVELLSDTGLGKEMHSVISQGRVESLVTSRPRDRRMLIEEAAGLGKHRKRRRRAQLKLIRTQDNLDRALDVEREARARLRPLKRQAEAAELHERLERQSLEIRWQLTRDDVRARRIALAAAQGGAAEVRARREALTGQLTETAARRQAAEEALAARSAHREELSRRAYAAKSAGERIGDRAESIAAALSSLTARRQRADQMLASLRREAAADQGDPDAAGRIAALQEALAALDRDREAELARQLIELDAELAQARGRVGACEQAAGAAKAARREAEESTEALRTVIREAERAAEGARREAARVGGELAAVNQFLRHHAAALQGAAALSDSLQVDPGYELAVAAALDGRLGAAVVDGLATAGGLLDRAGDEGGRALVAGGEPGDDSVLTSPRWSGRGTAQRLTERVRGSGEALALVRVLLSDAWVVDDLAQCGEDFAGVAVTRAGRVWSAPTRELRQAPAVGEDRVLAERNRRDRLVAATEAAAQAEVAARAEVQDAAERAGEGDAERERLVAGHRAAVRAVDEANEDVRRISAQIERRRSAPDDGVGGDGFSRRSQLTAELAAERSMVARAEQERAQRARRLERLGASVAHDRELEPLVEQVLSAVRAAGAAASGRLPWFDEALAADRAAGESAATQLRTCAQQEAELHQRMGRENDALTAAEVTLQRSRDQAADAEAELTRLAERLGLEAAPAEEELGGEARATLDARLERVARRREQLGPVNPLAQEEYAEALAHVEELEAQRADLETALRELERLIADTDKQIRVTFEQTFAATAAGFEELAAQLFPGGHGRLRLVSERDGRVGVGVIGGQQVGSGDEDAEDADGVDRADAEADADADAEDEERESEDLMGVEIEITPAGKDPKRLSLLSGGEKSMTALAFLFAVFLARPCPFYILDEVEAALDDLNISRFLTLLGQYSSRAQFIVVTHQKRTMEAADSLYGVSMGSDGISKVISRRLPPAVEAAA